MQIANIRTTPKSQGRNLVCLCMKPLSKTLLSINYHAGVPQLKKRKRLDGSVGTFYGESSRGCAAGFSSQERSPSVTVPPETASFTRMTFPSHDVHTVENASDANGNPLERHARIPGPSVDIICKGLKISREVYEYLMDAYFANMTSFSIFRPGSIESKLSTMRTIAEGESLIAGMFAYSSRFAADHDRPDHCPGPQHFAKIAACQLDHALDMYGDHTPSLSVLQACVLVTFYQITRAVRSRSWRTLGSCTRLAYDLNLHLVDADDDPNEAVGLNKWSRLEEKRRTWWTIWEMDVFASTIRRLPTAIDWSRNLTLLPVHDNDWFNDVVKPSCLLHPNPDSRWKDLIASQNRSSKAWEIVILSFMCSIQLIVYRSAMQLQQSKEEAACVDVNLTIIANILHCTTMSIPSELAYGHGFLDFRTRREPRDTNNRQHHCNVYSLHLMIQLCRFICTHHKICSQAPWLNADLSSPQNSREEVSLAPDWSNYTDAANNIVEITRNSSKDHFKYVSPFMTNTLWFAAAAQIACKVFGSPTYDHRLLNSNIELLQLTIGYFTEFWGIAETLQAKLAHLEAGLKKLVARTSESNGIPHDTLGPAHDSSNVETGLSYDYAASLATGPRLSEVGEPVSLAYSIMPDVNGMEPNTFYDLNSEVFNFPGQNDFMGTSAPDFFPYGFEELLFANPAYM